MYEGIMAVTDSLNILFQGWLLQHFFCKFMKRKVRASNCFLFLIWSITKSGLDLLLQSNYNTMISVGKRTALLLILFFSAIALYQAGMALKIYLSITFITVMEISFFLSYMVIVLGQYLCDFWTWRFENGFFSSPNQFLSAINITVIALQTIMYVVFALLFYFFLRMLINVYREKEYLIQKNELMFILTPSLVSLFFCILLRMVIVTVENDMPILLYQKYPALLVLVPIILILSLLSIVYGIVLLHDMISLNREKSGRLILQQQVSGMQEHFQEMNRIYNGIRGVKHDMKNQFAVLEQLAKQQDVKALLAHLSEMSQTMETLDYRFQTGNAVADAILNMKYHEAVQKMPELQMEASKLMFPERIKIQSYDLAVVLCNALDNAIEACLKLSEEREKFIFLKSYQKGKLFFIEIENSFNGQIVCANHSEFPKSQKKDQALHGVGLLNIKTAVWKYDGALDWEARKNIFSLTVMMKNE